MTSLTRRIGSVQFPLEKPLPYELISKTVRYRVGENIKRPRETKKGGNVSQMKERAKGVRVTRRKFIRLACMTGISLSALGLAACSLRDNSVPDTSQIPNENHPRPDIVTSKSTVYLVLTEDRKEGVKRCLELFDSLKHEGKTVLLKPNFNTADLAPGSTHNDTLEQLLVELQSVKPASLTVGERSGPPLTENVLKEKGVDTLCQRLDVPIINYDELSEEDWIEFRKEGLHWLEGFRVPRVVMDTDINVATCLLKTHAYGGVFSMALKLAVGLVPRRGYDYMNELHSSPHMRKMIAEINLAYQPDFVLMDGIDVFVDGGPDRGTRKKANVMLLSQDRIALDAVGLAVLKDLGSNKTVMDTPIFHQEQIARAVELGLGVSTGEDIEIISDDGLGEQYCQRLYAILKG